VAGAIGWTLLPACLDLATLRFSQWFWYFNVLNNEAVLPVGMMASDVMFGGPEACCGGGYVWPKSADQRQVLMGRMGRLICCWGSPPACC